MKKEAIARVKSWVEARLPSEHLTNRDAVVGVSEVECGDPNCAPIDAVVRIIYRESCGTIFGIPCEVQDVEEEDIESQMPPPEVIEDWYLGKPTPWPPEPEPQEPGPVPTDALRFAVGDRVRRGRNERPTRGGGRAPLVRGGMGPRACAGAGVLRAGLGPPRCGPRG